MDKTLNLDSKIVTVRPDVQIDTLQKLPQLCRDIRAYSRRLINFYECRHHPKVPGRSALS